MKFGIRTPSLTKRIAARTSWKRVVRHNMGFKAPRGFGWFTNPKRAAYNRVYNRTTVKADGLIVLAVVLVFTLLGAMVKGIIGLFVTRTSSGSTPAIAGEASTLCPQCSSAMILRNGKRGQFYGCSRFPRCRGTREYLQIAS
ncbi:MAG: hypothetical protein RLZZ347_19 [Candidatus Parcubacteria bacterium]|jgi:hypothetical protein